MKYRISADIRFEVDADSRAAAHIEAASRLVDAGLAGFDLASLNISGPIGPGDDSTPRDLMPGAIGDFIHGGPAADSGDTVMVTRDDHRGDHDRRVAQEKLRASGIDT